MAQIQVFDLLAPIAQVCRGCNTTTMTEAVIHAARELCRRSGVYASTLIGATTIDVALYNLGSDVYAEVCDVRAASVTVTAGSDVRALERRSSALWGATDANDVPEFFAYVAEGQLAVHPAPDAVYGLTIALVLQPKRGANSIEESLAVKWEGAFRAGALAYLLRIPGMPWSSANEAQRCASEFERWVNRATASAERAYAAPVRPVW